MSVNVTGNNIAPTATTHRVPLSLTVPPCFSLSLAVLAPLCVPAKSVFVAVNANVWEMEISSLLFNSYIKQELAKERTSRIDYTLY